MKWDSDSIDVFLAVLRKELTQTANRRRFAVERFAFAAAGALFLAWVAHRALDAAGGTAQPWDLAGFVRRSFETLVGFGSFIIPVLVGTYVQGSITSERKGGTLRLLVMTRLPASSILGGKVLAANLRVLTAVVASLPIIALLSAFGGIDWRTVTLTAVLVAANSLLYAVFGCQAALALRGTGGMLRGVGSILGLNMLFFALSAMTQGSSISAFFMSMTPSGPANVSGYAAGAAPIVSAAVALVALACFFFFREVGHFAGHDIALSEPLFEPERQKARQPAPPTARKSILGALNWKALRHLPPGVLLKEVSSCPAVAPIVLPILWVIVLGYLFLADSVEFLFSLANSKIQSTIFAVEAGAAMLFIMLMAASRITEEKERRTFVLLAATPLGPLRILASKAAGVLLTQLPFAAVLVLHALLLVALGVVPVWLAPFFLLSIAVALASSAVFGLYWSLASAKTAAALQGALLTALPCAVLLPFWAISPRDISSVYAVPVCLACAGSLVFFLYGSLRPLPRLMHGVSVGATAVALALSASWVVFRAPSRFAYRDSPLFFDQMWSIQAGYPPPGLVLLVAELAFLGWMVWVFAYTFDAQVRGGEAGRRS